MLFQWKFNFSPYIYDKTWILLILLFSFSANLSNTQRQHDLCLSLSCQDGIPGLLLQLHSISHKVNVAKIRDIMRIFGIVSVPGIRYHFSYQISSLRQKDCKAHKACSGISSRSVPHNLLTPSNRPTKRMT